MVIILNIIRDTTQRVRVAISYILTVGSEGVPI